MHKYEIILYWSNEDLAFITEAPELPGCRHTATVRKPLSGTSTTPCSSGSTGRRNWDGPSRSRTANA